MDMKIHAGVERPYQKQEKVGKISCRNTHQVLNGELEISDLFQCFIVPLDFIHTLSQILRQEIMNEIRYSKRNDRLEYLPKIKEVSES